MYTVTLRRGKVMHHTTGFTTNLRNNAQHDDEKGFDVVNEVLHGEVRWLSCGKSVGHYSEPPQEEETLSGS